MSTIRKVFNRYDINPYNGLNELQSFELEREVYKRLGKSAHFPRLIKSHLSKRELYLTNVGTSLFSIRQLPKFEPTEQIEAIFNTLNEKGITYLDMRKEGHNICFQKGTIYLIDFDIVALDGKAISPEIEERLSYYNEAETKQFMRNIILNKMRPIVCQSHLW